MITVRRVFLLIILLATFATLPLLSAEARAKTPRGGASSFNGASRGTGRSSVRARLAVPASDHALIHKVKWGDVHIRPAEIFDFTVVLRRISEVDVPFQLELEQIQTDGTSISLSGFPITQTVPANQRRLRVALPKALAAGAYLIRVSQFGGKVSHQTVFQVDADPNALFTRSGEVIRAETVVYTPLVRMKFDSPNAEPPVDDDDSLAPKAQINPLVRVSGVVDVAAAEPTPTVRGKKIFIEVITRDFVKAQTMPSVEKLDIKFKLYDNDRKELWVKNDVLKKDNRQHTFKLYATIDGTDTGTGLGKGHYLLTATRENAAANKPQPPVFIEFDIP